MAGEIRTEEIEYTEGDTKCKGFVAYPSGTDSRPAVFVVHAFAGREKFFDERAIALAKLGYIGFAIDVYGKHALGTKVEENFALMKPFSNDRSFLLRRTKAGLETLKGLPRVQKEKIAGIGYCFGGMAVIDMARANVPGIRGVISYHGNLAAPTQDDFKTGDIKTSLLICHGYDDPLILPEKTVEFCNEMKSRRADYYFISYGNAAHAFTEPHVSKWGIDGVSYNQKAEERSWAETGYFLGEVFRQ